MQTRLPPINMVDEVVAQVPAARELPIAQPVQELELGPALAARERRLVLAAQELALSPAELERELDLAALELGPVEREPSPPEAELRPVLIG